MCRSKLPEYSTEFLNMDGQHKRSSNSSISWLMEVYVSASTGLQLACSCISRVMLIVALLLICSKVFCLCFPSPSTTSEASGLYSYLTILCHLKEVFNLVDHGYIPYVYFIFRSFNMLFLICRGLHSSRPTQCWHFSGVKYLIKHVV